MGIRVLGLVVGVWEVGLRTCRVRITLPTSKEPLLSHTLSPVSDTLGTGRKGTKT